MFVGLRFGHWKICHSFPLLGFCSSPLKLEPWRFCKLVDHLLLFIFYFSDIVHLLLGSIYCEISSSSSFFL